MVSYTGHTDLRTMGEDFAALLRTEKEKAMTEQQPERKEEYKELRPANAYDVAANETWLEDMARQGYRLIRMTGWSGVFEKTEPFTCRYRMQPLPKKEKAPTAGDDRGLPGAGLGRACRTNQP